MSLDYDLTRIDRTSAYWTDGTRLDAVTEALIFVTMAVEVADDGVITTVLAPEFFARVHAWERFRGFEGALVGTDKGPRPIEWADVVGHIGLRTNVFPAITRRGFITKLTKILRDSRFGDEADTRPISVIKAEISAVMQAADEIVRLEMALTA